MTLVTAPARITVKNTPMIASSTSLAAYLTHLVQEQRQGSVSVEATAHYGTALCTE